MLLRKGQLPILLTVAIATAIFSILFLSRQNYEFIIYIFVIIFFLGLVLLTNHKVNYPNTILWGLSIWAILHMAGGGLYIGDKKLYGIMLLPLVGEPYHILRFDQFVHAFGFFVATFVAFHLLRPHLKKRYSLAAIGIVTVMAGLGFGALNEIVEFAAVVTVPDTGVGGYINTALDLVFNLIGAIVAWLIIRNKEKRQVLSN